MTFVQHERSQHEVYPPKPEVFAALHLTALADTRVVILGQDPTTGHDKPMACASLYDTVCRNLLRFETSTKSSTTISTWTFPAGSLERWASNGVLLLNTTLTVRAHQAAPHQGKGWERFTDRVIEVVANKPSPVVFILWGASAERSAT